MSAKKMKLTSASHSDFTLEALIQIAPSAFTEVRDEQGELTHKIDFDVLRELLGDKILDSDEERFGFYWVGKQDAKRAFEERTRKTLRPVLEDSVDWDKTQNLYIEGDNLEVLKLLRSAYLGRVKMIYIDPPYNTGNDFVYDDDFAMSREEMDEAMGNLDEEGNRLRRNLDSNPRYHSDWCSMIYSRLLAARPLLSNDGVIFISIDDNEVHHLRMICDEIFGAGNFVGQWSWFKSATPPNLSKKIKKNLEYILAYQKGENNDTFRGVVKESTSDDPTTKPQNSFKVWTFAPNTLLCKLPDGVVKQGTYGTEKYPNELLNDLVVLGGKNHNEVSFCNRFIWTQETLDEQLSKGTIVRLSKQLVISYKKAEYGAEVPPNLIDASVGVDTTEKAGVYLDSIIGSKVFDYPKPISLLSYIINFLPATENDIILDFFSGSATTAHAVMQLNAEDGGKRKYICVQLPEQTPGESEARKAGYDTICEIGKERIRRAGKNILGDLYGKQTEILSNFSRFAIGEDVDKDPKLWQYIEDEAIREQAKQELEAIDVRIQNLDTGFRVLRVDTSNMEEVYFEPAALQQDQLFAQVDSVKEDRSDMDLLFGCMVDWGVELSSPLRQEEVAGKHLHIVNEGALVAYFEEYIDLEVLRAIAKLDPQRVLFRESCFASDADKLNIYEQFKQLCGWSAEESYRRIHVI